MAVELKELRVGNFVKKGNAHQPFTMQIMYDSFVGKDSFSDYDYILLTQELLENLGFKIENTFLEFVKLELSFDGKLFECFRKSDDSEKTLNYLHQLQNRFYSFKLIELMDVVAYNYYLKQRFNIGTTPYIFEEFMCANSSQSNGNDNSYKFKQLPQNLFD